MFKVSNKDTKTMRFSTVNFEQINAGWVIIVTETLI